MPNLLLPFILAANEPAMAEEPPANLLEGPLTHLPALTEEPPVADAIPQGPLMGLPVIYEAEDFVRAVAACYEPGKLMEIDNWREPSQPIASVTTRVTIDASTEEEADCAKEVFFGTRASMTRSLQISDADEEGQHTVSAEYRTQEWPSLGERFAASQAHVNGPQYRLKLESRWQPYEDKPGELWEEGVMKVYANGMNEEVTETVPFVRFTVSGVSDTVFLDNLESAIPGGVQVISNERFAQGVDYTKTSVSCDNGLTRTEETFSHHFGESHWLNLSTKGSWAVTQNPELTNSQMLWLGQAVSGVPLAEVCKTADELIENGEIPSDAALQRRGAWRGIF